MKKKMNRKRVLITSLFLIVFVIGAFYIGLQGKLQKFSKEVSSIHINNIDLDSIDDGTYQGEYYHNDSVGAKVKVTIVNNELTNITFLDHKYGKGKKAEDIVSAVIEKQSLQVDAISGATGSSIIILKAIEDALVE